MKRILNPVCYLFVLFVLCGIAPAADPFTDAVESRANEILASVDDEHTLEEAWNEARELADFVAANASTRQLSALIYSEATHRLLGLSIQQGVRSRNFEQLISESIDPLQRTPKFRTQLALLIHQRDDLANVFTLAGQLATERTDMVERFPGLAAAVCVVHDKDGYSRRINENNASAPAILDLFDYFTRNNGRFSNDLSGMPAPLLVHVVDVTESIDQLEWALKTYGNFPKIGDRFFEIDYDTAHFRDGKPKKVTEAGDYCIQSIKQHGGVCADQAYFAESVAKACGIPSCYVVARGADVSHAWIGFLDARGRSRAWNFDSGRYEAYQNLRGMVRDPQTGETVADGQIGVLAGMISGRDDQYLATAAAQYAAQRMSTDDWEAPEIPELGAMRGVLKSPRTGSIDDRLGLLKLAMSKCSSVPAAWETIVGFAADGQLDEKTLDVWSRSLFAMTGNKHPDFTFDLLGKMIAAEEDPNRQAQMWEWAFKKYRARPDLASSVRMEQGRLMEDAGKPELAWSAYANIVDSFLNDGPMCVDALVAMERLLESQGKRGAILPYLKAASQRVQRPDDMSPQFAVQSNYYKIKSHYARELERSGDARAAAQIRDELGIKRP